MTHGHQDHAGGASAVVSGIPVKNIMIAREEFTPALKKLINATLDAVFIPIYQDQQIMLDGTRVSIILDGIRDQAKSNNESSAVIKVTYGSHSFLFTGDLEAKGEQEILIKKLREQENSIDIISGRTRRIDDSLENTLVNELLNYPEIDYEEHRELLFHLVNQAIEKFQSYLTDEEIINVVQYHKNEIGAFIYHQMMDHFYCEPAEYKKPIVYPFAGIKEHNYSKIILDKLYHYSETITPTSAIPSKVFFGFKKAYHSKYKFDSKTEKDFAYILENDSSVLKWLRPAKGQFSIYWHCNTQQYNPDFVVETADTIYMVETKKEGEIESSAVQEKTKAALLYCKTVTEYTTANQGKPWKYVLIPHTVVLANMSFDTLMKRFEVRDI